MHMRFDLEICIVWSFADVQRAFSKNVGLFEIMTALNFQLMKLGLVAPRANTIILNPL